MYNNKDDTVYWLQPSHVPVVPTLSASPFFVWRIKLNNIMVSYLLSQRSEVFLERDGTDGLCCPWLRLFNVFDVPMVRDAIARWASWKEIVVRSPFGSVFSGSGVVESINH